MRLAYGAKPSPFHMKNLKWLMPVDIIILKKVVNYDTGRDQRIKQKTVD